MLLNQGVWGTKTRQGGFLSIMTFINSSLEVLETVLFFLTKILSTRMILKYVLMTYILRRRSICIPPAPCYLGRTQQLWWLRGILSKTSGCWRQVPVKKLESNRWCYDLYISLFLFYRWHFSVQLHNLQQLQPRKWYTGNLFPLGNHLQPGPCCPSHPHKSMTHFFRELHVF